MDLLTSLGSITDGLTGATVDAATLRSRAAVLAESWSRQAAPRDFVIFKKSNSSEFFISLFACWQASLIPVLLSPGASKLEMENVCRALGAKLLLDDSGVHPLGGGHGRAAGISEAYNEEAVPSSKAMVPDSIRRETALVMLTSGTLDHPKGIFISRQALADKFSALSKVISSREIESTMCLLPLCFGHGLICNSLFPLLSGASLHVYPAFDIQRIEMYVRALASGGINFVSTVPVLLKVLMQQSVVGHQIRRIHCASAPLPIADWFKANQWLGGSVGLTHVYGMTEFTGWISGSEANCAPQDGYVGSPWGVEFRTADFANPAGESADENATSFVDASNGNGEPGEICIRGAGAMSGYLAEGAFHEFDRKKWFSSGDLGKLEGQQLTLIGRVKNIVNYGGYKVYPEDIERLLESHPLVQEACCFAMNNENLGEVPAVACVVKGSLSEAQLKSWCAERIESHKVPVRWFFVNQLPRTDRGKLLRTEVRKQFSAPGT